jgi:F0F1-type ATP synthase assembly protein I
MGSFRTVPSKPDKSLIWLSKYLSLALTLPASVGAGYMLGAFADHFLHLPLLRAAGILVGMAAGLIQIIRELTRESKK